MAQTCETESREEREVLVNEDENEGEYDEEEIIPIFDEDEFDWSAYYNDNNDIYIPPVDEPDDVTENVEEETEEFEEVQEVFLDSDPDEYDYTEYEYIDEIEANFGENITTEELDETLEVFRDI